MSDHAIVVDHLERSFRGTPVLAGLDLRVARGSVYGLLGPNGAGKTTLVRVLSTLLTPHGGTARILGHDVVADRDRLRGLLGLTGQYASVDDLLTGRENLVMFARLLGLPAAAARRRADGLLERFDLARAANARVDTYSGGMRRRLDLAASLLARPAVVFLDEPTTGLDPRSRRTLWETITDLAREGTTVLLTTQYLDEADHLADRIGVLDGGRLLVEGTAHELKAHVGQELLTVTVTVADIARATALLGPGAAAHDRTPGRLGVPLRGSAHLRDLLARLDADGIEVTDLRVSAPTLDDVFLALTDRSATESAA
ncbi:MAG TPA: ATP-binding cassette domain-containing protein [Egicoccus sp.]|nr:ATP-binding cassette domain-containing protein [Egicoccus sp.]HSK24069.1 ATP-binding cassette domain-containing protein [Egicoccus sp.]